jgi:NitT/TauT family transport system substrate-binding protein
MSAVHRWTGPLLGAALAVAGLTGLTACGGGAAGGSGPVTLRLGYFPNLTHATPIVGMEKGFLTKELGADIKLDVKTFNAGPEAVEALFSGAVDAVYIGPNPTVNAWQKSRGKAVKVIAGAASGGAFFVVKPTITVPEQLKGKKIASPQLGNTQDVALRYWLKQHGLTATREGAGDVSIVPQSNSDAVTAFGTGAIDGAWLPEPYASRLVAAGGKVLVDERDLWPGGRFVVTNLVVSTTFLNAHRDAVKKLLAGQVATNAFIAANPAQAQQAVSAGIGKLTGKPLDLRQTAAAWRSLEFLDDPVAASLREGARHAQEVGLLDPVNLDGLYDLSLLNQVLTERGSPEVAR